MEGVTGTLVADGVDAFADGMRRVLDTPIDRDAIRANAEKFSREAFRDRFAASVAEAQDATS